MSSTGKTPSRRSAKKRMAETDPRRRPGGRHRTDRSILVLIILALLLLAAIFIIPGRCSRTSGRRSAKGTDPVVERVDPEERPPAPTLPAVDLGVPDPPAQPVQDEADAEESVNAGDATARLFFVWVNAEGKMSFRSVLRSVPSSPSPLRVAVNALLDGPRPEELSNDLLSLVPQESRLLNARVENEIAFLDFSEDFRFNTLGIEGYRAQVEQIVYTATEFPTVKKVQFLIEGQRVDYLGGEGFWVGEPLGRENL